MSDGDLGGIANFRPERIASNPDSSLRGRRRAALLKAAFNMDRTGVPYARRL
jgi:hypothetical protein